MQSYIKNIVNVVSRRDYQIKKGKITSEFVKTEQTLTPDKKELDDTMTDLVTNYFLKDNKNITAYIGLIINVFENAVNEYKKINNLNDNDIIFIYKGGNVLRIIANEFINELPGNGGEILEKYYGKYFKKSDADFSLLIDPRIENFDKYYEEITTLSYLLLNLIRNAILSNPKTYFDFYSQDLPKQQEILNEFINKFI